MNESAKQQILEGVRRLLDAPDVTVRMVRSVRNTTKPKDKYETYEPGKGQRIYIEIPCSVGEYYNVAGE